MPLNYLHLNVFDPKRTTKKLVVVKLLVTTKNLAHC